MQMNDGDHWKNGCNTEYMCLYVYSINYSFQNMLSMEKWKERASLAARTMDFGSL